MAKTSEETRLLGAREVREALGISAATYYRWLKTGKLKGFKVGRNWRFTQAHIDELMGNIDPAVADRRQALTEVVGALGGSAEGGSADVAGEIAGRLIERTLAHRGTDLHLSPVADGLQVRERIHGVLRALDPPLPEDARETVIRAVKLRAGLDPDVRDEPQAGRFFFPFEGRKVDVHASTYPTGLGESITIRLLDPAAVTVELEATGFREPIVRGLRKLMRHRKGVIIVNGPTGSGKTTTLYCMLRELANPGRKVMTVEDPVELHLDGLLQANIGRGMDFTDAMKAMLSNDVDVGMASEMRDSDSMRLLFQMANTGHLMLTAMHAPDAVTVIQRLLEFGKIEPRLVVENLLGVLDQRLVGRSCPHCRRPRKVAKADADLLGLSGNDRRKSVAYNAGCDECGQTGVVGRTVVGELLTLTPLLRHAIEERISSPEDLSLRLPEDYFRLRDDAVWRLFAKEVTPEAAVKVLSL